MYNYYLFGSQNVGFQFDLNRNTCTITINGNKSVISITELQKDLIRMNNYINRIKKDSK